MTKRPMQDRITPELLESAKRASDMVNSYLSWYSPFDIANKWLKFKLDDGTCDGVLYDSKRDAVKHTNGNEFFFAYFPFRNCLGGTNAREMAIYLLWHRDAYDRGMRLPDPHDVHGGKEVLITAARGDIYRQAMMEYERIRLMQRQN